MKMLLMHDEDFLKHSRDWNITSKKIGEELVVIADTFLKNNVEIILTCHPEEAYYWYFQTIVAGHIDGSLPNILYSSAELAYRAALENIVERNL